MYASDPNARILHAPTGAVHVCISSQAQLQSGVLLPEHQIGILSLRTFLGEEVDKEGAIQPWLAYQFSQNLLQLRQMNLRSLE